MVMDIDGTASHVDLIYFFLSEDSACVESRRGESLEKVSSGIAGHIPSFRTISLRSSFDTRLRRTCPSSMHLSSHRTERRNPPSALLLLPVPEWRPILSLPARDPGKSPACRGIQRPPTHRSHGRDQERSWFLHPRRARRRSGRG